MIFVLFHRDLRGETIINEHPVQTCFVRDCSIPIVYFSLKSNKKNSIPVFHRWAFSTRLNLMYFFYHKMIQQLCPPERQQKNTYITQIVEKRVNSFTPNFRWGSKRPTLKVRYVVTRSWRSDGTIRWNLHLKKSDRLKCEVCMCTWDESGHRESKIKKKKRERGSLSIVKGVGEGGGSKRQRRVRWESYRLIRRENHGSNSRSHWVNNSECRRKAWAF